MNDHIERIDQLVKQYQNGDKQAAETLLDEYLQPIILTMARLLRGRGYTHRSGIAVRWVLLWVSGEDRARFRKAYKGRVGYEIANRALNTARSTIASVWDDDDIMQEVQMAVLELASRYEDQGSNFLTYLTSSLPAELRWKIRNMIPDSSQKTINLEPEEAERMRLVVGYSPSDHAEAIPELNDTWVNGATAGSPFQSLSPIERHILKRMDYEGRPGKEVAEELKMPLSTVYYRRTKAVEKVEAEARKMGLLHKEEEEYDARASA